MVMEVIVVDEKYGKTSKKLKIAIGIMILLIALYMFYLGF